MQGLPGGQQGRVLEIPRRTLVQAAQVARGQCWEVSPDPLLRLALFLFHLAPASASALWELRIQTCDPEGLVASREESAAASLSPAALVSLLSTQPPSGSPPPQGADCRGPWAARPGGREEVLRVTHCLTAFPPLSVRCSPAEAWGRCLLGCSCSLTGRCSG